MPIARRDQVHLEAIRFARANCIVLVGHKDHDEVIGTLGEVPDRTFLVETVEDVDKLDIPDPERVCYLTQTTLSLDETRDIMVRLKERFPAIQGPPAQDICYATENRQMAVKAVAMNCDLLLVSAPTTAQIPAPGRGRRSACDLTVNDRTEIDTAWLERVRSVAVTAGASAPEHLVSC